MDPVGAVVVDEIDDRAERPRQRVGHVDILDLMNNAHDDRDIGDADHLYHDRHAHCS